jgi:subtilisin family serine protease
VRRLSNWRTRLALVAAAAAAAVATTSVGMPAAGAVGTTATATAKRPAAHAGWPVDAVAGSLLVTATDLPAARGLAKETHGVLAGRTVEVRVAPGAEVGSAARLRRERGVLAVEPDHLRNALAQPNDPLYPQQWAHVVADAEPAWAITTGKPDVTVAIIDGGVDGTHQDLAGNIIGQVDVSSGAVVQKGTGVNNDPCAVGHGTAVAGVIGAVGNNGLDVAGVAWKVGLLDIAAGDPDLCGVFSDSAILTGITYATSRHVDVINLSLGAPGDTCPTSFQTALDSARAAGIAVVAAAGNEEQFAPGLTSIPASCNGVIGVGAVGEQREHAPYSNANDWVDIAAPGGDTTGGRRGILSTAPGNATTTEEGTSFASPYVAGTIALMRSVNRALSPDDLESILETTASGSTGQHTPTLGWGIVDVGRAVQRAAAADPVPPPAPEPPFPVGLVVRVSDQTGTTDPVRQAVAVSRFVFPDRTAQQAVLARRDDFADALSGSSLAFGAGPVLFASRTGPLDPITAAELKRTLLPGGIVYILGGTAALPASIEDDVSALGLTPRRIAGPTRQATGAAVADEIIQRAPQLGFPAPTKVLLATAFNWPDAVTAGSFGAWFGYPILLTRPDALSPETRDELAKLHPDRVYVVGGTSAISNQVAAGAGFVAGTGDVVRMAGADRSETAVAVASRFVTDLRADSGTTPVLAIGVNLRRSDGFADVLSASAAIGAFSGVFLPVEGEAGDNVPGSVVALACSLDPVRGIVAGERDIVSDLAKQRLNALLEHTAPDCPRPSG